MKKPIYIILIILTLIGVPLFYYMALDTSVSIKYETDYGECISQVTGTDLCLQHDIFMGLTYGCGILFFLLLIFNKQILKKTDKM